MGCVTSIETEAVISTTNDLSQYRKEYEKKVRILLYGPKGTGKSTFIKQLRSIEEIETNDIDRDIDINSIDIKTNIVSDGYTFHFIHPLKFQQQSEWRKYKHIFQGVRTSVNGYDSWDSVTNAVIFFASLDCYDLNTYNLSKLVYGFIDTFYDIDIIPRDLITEIERFCDISCSAMKQQLDMYQDIVNDPVFTNCIIFLFLNKEDILKEKLQKKPLDNGYPCFEEFEGDGSNHEQVIKYIRQLFGSMHHKKRGLNDYVISAKDIRCVERIWMYIRWSVIPHHGTPRIGLI